MSKVAIVTLGCPKNAIDSEGLGGLLGAGGHEVTEDPENGTVAVDPATVPDQIKTYGEIVR